MHRLLPNSALNYFEFLIDERDRVVGEMYWITDGTARSLVLWILSIYCTSRKNSALHTGMEPTTSALTWTVTILLALVILLFLLNVTGCREQHGTIVNTPEFQDRSTPWRMDRNFSCLVRFPDVQPILVGCGFTKRCLQIQKGVLGFVSRHRELNRWCVIEAMMAPG